MCRPGSATELAGLQHCRRSHRGDAEGLGAVARAPASGAAGGTELLHTDLLARACFPGLVDPTPVCLVLDRFTLGDIPDV